MIAVCTIPVVKMSRPYLATEHFLSRAESRRDALRAAVKDVRPEWLDAMAADIAELFQPFEDVARAGYRIDLADDHWELTVFLGTTEKVGGPADGEISAVDFAFDVLGLLRYFEEIDECHWTAIVQQSAQSLINVSGVIEGHPIRVRVTALPPQDADVGLRMHSDGNVEPT